MNKIQVRCVKGFGVIGQLHNIEVVKPLPGFGYSKRLYCCAGCGELFVLDLDNPSLNGSTDLPNDLSGACPKCNATLVNHLLPYPENIFVTGSVTELDASNISYDRDASSVQEFWLID